MEEYIREIRKQGDTVGGTVSCVIQNVPIGLGEPCFRQVHAELGKAMLSINAVKVLSLGADSLAQNEREVNIMTYTMLTVPLKLIYLGIQGISNGMDIYFTVAFKPVATIMQKKESLDNKGNITEMTGKGRHDPCVVPRAVPIIEAMAASSCRFYLINKTYNK
jgi:chorismate synthase